MSNGDLTLDSPLEKQPWLAALIETGFKESGLHADLNPIVHHPNFIGRNWFGSGEAGCLPRCQIKLSAVQWASDLAIAYPARMQELVLMRADVGNSVQFTFGVAH